jgi:hypothetical protein
VRAPFSDALLRVVIDGWPRFSEAGPILGKDDAFREWVMTRLGSPAIDKDDAQTIRDLAKASCPKGQSRTCDDLLSALDAGKPLQPIQMMPSAGPAAPKPAEAKK